MRRGRYGFSARSPRIHSAPATDEAEGYYREAFALAERLDMRPLVAHCHRGLGTLFGRTASRELADEHLTTATAMYREMGMAFWLERRRRRGSRCGEPTRSSSRDGVLAFRRFLATVTVA